MKQLRNRILQAGFDALYFSGAHHLLRPLLSGVGAIFMLHHVRPASDAPFQPNRHLEITPDFLRATLTHVRELGLDIVTLDEMHRRLRDRDFSRRFACFTFDDGYRDNRDFAAPVLREFDAPFTVFATSDFADGTGGLWWVALERLVSKVNSLDAPIGNGVRLDASTLAGKKLTFDVLHGWLRGLPTDQDLRDAVQALCAQHQVDSALSGDLCMSWDQMRLFAEDPLVTIGAHTVSHATLAKATDSIASYEMAANRAKLEDTLQRPVLHLAYPYGDRMAATVREFTIARTLGFKTAVTTRPGMVFAENGDHLTALPRISLNGNYQERRFLSVLTSGAATAIWNGFRRVDAA